MTDANQNIERSESLALAVPARRGQLWLTLLAGKWKVYSNALRFYEASAYSPKQSVLPACLFPNMLSPFSSPHS